MVVVVLIVGVTAVVAAATGLVPAGPAEIDETNGTGLGTQLTAFVRASATETGGSVDATLWRAAVDRSSDPAADVQRRTDELSTRLENRTDRLRLLRANGTIPAAVYTVRASSIRARTAALNRSPAGVNGAATPAGVGTTALDRLRSRARGLTGAEVAAIARSITGVGGDPPAGTRGNPPGGGTGGPAGNGTAR